jgi:hypothetical protein
MFKTLDETKLDNNHVDIDTHLPVYVTMSTIPSRMNNTFKIVKHFLNNVHGNLAKVIINIPYKYNRWPLHPVIIKHDINDSRFLINRTEDYGPLTKFLPSLSIIPENSITIICDDMCYKLDAFKDIAELQDNNRNKSYSFYVYPYGEKFGVPVLTPQGADLISMYTRNAQMFPQWFDDMKKSLKLSRYYNSPCFFVDDQVIGWYFQYNGIPLIQVDRKHRNIYIRDCDKSSKHDNLNMQTGKNSRDNTMKGCYNELNKVFPF